MKPKELDQDQIFDIVKNGVVFAAFSFGAIMFAEATYNITNNIRGMLLRHSIQELIDNHDYINAQSMVHENGSILTPESILSLEYQINKGIHLSPTERLNQRALRYSKNLPREIETTTVSDLEARVVSNPEDQLYQKIIHATNEIPELAQEYLRLYPDGKFIEDVIVDYLQHEIYLFSKAMQNERDFHKSYLQLLDLIALTESFQHQDINFTDVVQRRIRPSIVDEHLDKAYSIIDADLEPGSLVLVGEPLTDRWEEEYLQERQEKIPVGTIGTVAKLNRIVVHVETRGENYYRRDTGRYVGQELIPIQGVTDQQQTEFRDRIASLRTILSSYTQE